MKVPIRKNLETYLMILLCTKYMICKYNLWVSFLNECTQYYYQTQMILLDILILFNINQLLVQN